MNDFIKRLKQSGKTTRKAGICRPRTERKRPPTSILLKLLLSQEDARQTHSTVWQIARGSRINTPGSTPVRQQHQCWRSFALFLACQYPTFLLSIQFVPNA